MKHSLDTQHLEIISNIIERLKFHPGKSFPSHIPSALSIERPLFRIIKIIRCRELKLQCYRHLTYIISQLFLPVLVQFPLYLCHVYEFTNYSPQDIIERNLRLFNSSFAK